MRHWVKTRWTWVALLLMSQVVLAWGEMYVEGYLGGMHAANSRMEVDTPPVRTTGFLSGCTTSKAHHHIPGKFDPAFMGGVKVGTWFVPEGVGGFNYPKFMKHFGFYIDFNYHRLVFPRQGGKTFDQSINILLGPATSISTNNFFSEGYAATLAFMFAGRLGFFPDAEVPFGRLQPFIAVGPAILFSGQEPKLSYYDSYGNFHTFTGSDSSTDLCLAVDAGLRYMALKNLSISLFFKYRYARPHYQYSWGVLAPTYNLFAGGLGVAYHF